MFSTSPESTFFIQGIIVAIIIGVFYNFWISSKAYGGIIGTAVRFLGVGMIFITIAVLEKIFVNFGIIAQTPNMALIQDLLNLVGLFFLARGFSKLGSAAKA